VLLRMINNYQQMTSSRREADREKKKRQSARNRIGGVARVGVLHPDQAAPTDSRSTDSLNQIRAILAEIHSGRPIACGCDPQVPWKARVSGNHPTAAELQFEVECQGCGQNDRLSVDRDRFKEIGLKLKSQDRSGSE
jgi:hypothetical protein